MAGISFMDLLLAQALAAGLEREARSASRPPPENFFRLPSDPGAWRKLKEACKEEHMVVVIEITDSVNENCRQLQAVFMDIAREIDNIPFVRVQVGDGGTFDELRKDLGGIQFTPTFLVVFFGDGSTYRAKYEGTLEIREGLRSGQFKMVIKEFMDRRVKLKLAERLASNLADQVSTQMNDRERRIRQEYEDRMRKQMAERDEQAKKEEEEKKHREEEERHKLEKKKMQANERRKQARPEHIAQLRKLNLKTAPIKEIKTIMHEMGIGTTDCFERGDLVKKLMDSCPELRLSQEDPAAQQRAASFSSRGSASSMSSSYNDSFDFGDPLGANSSLDSSAASLALQVRADKSEKEAENLKKELSALKSLLATKQKEIDSLDKQLKRMTTRANSAEGQALASMQRSPNSGQDKAKELERKLVETRMLYATSINDYDVQGVIHSPGVDEEGLVVRAKCIKDGLPNPDRSYAMKILTNYFQVETQSQVRRSYENEYQILCQLPPHKNVINMWAFFYDRTDPAACAVFSKLKPSAQRKLSLFLLMDEHTTSMKGCLDTLISNRGPIPAKVIGWFTDLLQGLEFLESHRVVHRDLKLSNLLMDEHGNVVISDFGKAILLEDGSMQLPYQQGFGGFIGGNTAHMSPEVLNARKGRNRFISYLKQPVWAAGVLAYELAGHKSPFEGGNIDQRGYNVAEVPALKHTFATAMKYHQPLPATLTKLVGEMIDVDPARRPTLRDCLDRVSVL